jgi:hypothetical protein
MSTASLAAYVDAAAVNRLLQRWLDLNPSALSWKADGQWLSFHWSFDVQIPEPPAVSFGPQGAGADPRANVGIRASNVQVSVGIKPMPPLKLAFDLTLDASVTTAGARIEIGDISVRLTPCAGVALTEDHKRGGLNEGAVKDAVEAVLSPAVKRWAIGLPLPQVHELFGADLDAALVGVSVPDVHGTYMLCAIAELSRHAGAARTSLRAPAPPEAARARGDAGKVILLVAEAALNLASDVLLERQVSRIRQTRKELGAKIGLKTRVRTDIVKIRIPGPTASASAKVSFRKTRGGVRWGSSWTWARVRIKNARARVDLSLGMHAGGRAGNITFRGIHDLKVKVKRGQWGVSARTLDDLIDDIVDELLPLVNRWLRGKRIELFRLPDTIPGTQIPLGLRFAHHGLRFSRGLVMAEVVIDPAK